MKRLISFMMLLLPAPVSAADRAYVVTSFDRVRVDGPFDVRLSTRHTPSARVEASIRAADGIAIRVEGTTLIVSAGAKGWSEIPQTAATGAPILYLGTQALRSATVIGDGQLQVTGQVQGQRIDVQVTGSGSVTIRGLDADQLNATLLGSGTMTLGGRGGRVRLLTSGAGVLDASGLRGDDVTVRLDGSGSTKVTARYTADATSTGVGAITIYGKPACKVKAIVGGPLSCGEIAVAPGEAR